MPVKTIKYGKWPSAVSAEFVAGKTLRFQSVQAFGGDLYWSEMHPEQDGRVTIMRARCDGPALELVKAPWSVSSKVHEYGGGAFLATEKTLFFVNAKDQQIWALELQPDDDNTRTPSNTPTQLTHLPDWRFSDFSYDEQRQRLVCIGEKHHEANIPPLNMIVSIALQNDNAGELHILVEGDDFYASPRLSPDGQDLAYISWNLPDMPWESARLHVVRFTPQGQITSTIQPADTLDGACFQPEWDRNGALWFINDASGYGQLYRHNRGQQKQTEPELFAIERAECGAPLWNLGMKTYGFLSDGRLAGISLVQGKAVLFLIDPRQSPYPHQIIEQDEICALDQFVIWNDKIAGLVSQYAKPQAIATMDIKNGKLHTLKSSATFDLPASELSIATTLSFENEHGQTVYGHYYSPTNSQCRAPENELPPVILTAHGGPTAFSDCGLKPKVQFWTSRGFGYFDINYSGSWGFGKAYRQRLTGQWGRADVADMAAAARFLATAGLGDPERLLISGSSAGGYSVLMALVSSNLFAAGASYYGISDLARLNDSTHKFEAGYTQSLLGLTHDNQQSLLKQLSPLKQADKISTPMIFFQGLQDKVVPPEQADLMVRALQKRGLKTVYKSFEKEGHGFRSSQTIKTALEMEVQFYIDVLDI